MGTHLTVLLLPPPEGDEKYPVSYFKASVNNLCEHALQNCNDSDMIGITIRKELNKRDKAIGITFRRKDQLSTDVILYILQLVTQSNWSFTSLY